MNGMNFSSEVINFLFVNFIDFNCGVVWNSNFYFSRFCYFNWVRVINS